MDYSKQPLYGADYISAVIIAIALTIFFASVIRERNYRAWREFPAKLWILGVGSWAAGFVVMFLGAVLIRWLPLAAAVVSLVVIIFAVIRAAAAADLAEPKPPRPAGLRSVLVLYFCATLLVLLGTVFARSYFSAIS